MKTAITRQILIISAMGLFTVPLAAAGGSSRGRAETPPPQPPKKVIYGPDRIEAYLTTQSLDFIRPGLKIKVNSIVIGSDRKPVVDITLTDDLDQPLDRLGKTTPGAISVSFILASYDPATR